MPDAFSSLSAVTDSIPTNNQLATNAANLFISGQQYKRQRKDALEFWHMQNTYNSPQEQMKRFAAAGLNPNLIYGRGESGNSGPVEIPEASPPQWRSAEFQGNAGSTTMANMLMQADLKIKNAQANNLQAQGDLIRQDILLRGKQYERSGFDLDFERDTYGYNFDFRRERARALRVQSDVNVDRNVREAVKNASDVREAAERMITMAEQRKILHLERARSRAETLRTQVDTDRLRKQIDLMEKDGRIKDFEIELNKKGLTPRDPLWQRAVVDFLDLVYESMRLTPKGTSKFFKGY